MSERARGRERERETDAGCNKEHRRNTQYNTIYRMYGQSTKDTARGECEVRKTKYIERKNV